MAFVSAAFVIGLIAVALRVESRGMAAWLLFCAALNAVMLLGLLLGHDASAWDLMPPF